MQAQEAATTAMYAALGAPLVTGRKFIELGEKIGSETRETFGDFEFDDPTATRKLFMDLSGKITYDTLTTLSAMAAFTEWVDAGREVTGQLQENLYDRKVIEQVQHTVEEEIEQIQDTVGVLREQLEDAMSTWRDQFAPSVRRPSRTTKVKVQKADESEAKKTTTAATKPETTATKAPATKAPTKKAPAKTTTKAATKPKTTTKAATKPKTTKAATKAPAKKAPAKKAPATKTTAKKTTAAPKAKTKTAE